MLLKRRSLTVFLFALTSLGLGAQDLKLREVTFKDLRDGFKNTSRWLTYSGDYSSRLAQPAERDHSRERQQARGPVDI